jgi:hypothetical protein
VLKFLIDECLTLELVEVAVQGGYVESSHVVWLGKSGWKDWELKRFLVEEDWTFVTRNSTDFRGPAGAPGTEGQYAGVPIHAALVCLNGPDGMDADLQCEMFRLVLDEIGYGNEIVNEVIEAEIETLESDCEISRYWLPVEADTEDGFDPERL